jgi:hypothetical protein
VVSQLDARITAEVDDIIRSPPQQDPYTTLKTELIKRACPSKDQRTRQLFTLEEMGGPAAFTVPASPQEPCA